MPINTGFDMSQTATRQAPYQALILFAHGARFGGHALYIKDRKLKYVYNFVGDVEQIIESAEPLPTGVRASWTRSAPTTSSRTSRRP